MKHFSSETKRTVTATNWDSQLRFLLMEKDNTLSYNHPHLSVGNEVSDIIMRQHMWTHSFSK